MFLLLSGCEPKTAPGDDSAGAPCAESTWFRDGDGDGFGDPEAPAEGCEPPAGFVADGSDCDDTRADVHPGVTETCEGIDADCDGVPGTTNGSWYTDGDGDGYGDDATVVESCEAPATGMGSSTSPSELPTPMNRAWGSSWARSLATAPSPTPSG